MIEQCPPLGSKLTAAYRRVLLHVARGELLSGERALGYGFAFCLAYAIVFPCLWFMRLWPIGPDGFPVAADFVNVWAAGFLAVSGEAAAVYNWALHKQAEIVAIGRDFDVYFGWHYPPMFLFVAAPLSLLPYVAAWLVWIVAGLLILLGSLRPVLPAPVVVLGVVAAPTTLFCSLAGQNGLLTAGLVAGVLASLDRRPWLSGALLGLLTYKPQYGLLFPLVLVLTRRWTTFFAAALTALIFAGASALVFGVEVWAAFVESVSVSVNDVLRRGGSDWSKLQSFYAVFFQVSNNDAASWAVHIVASTAVASAVALIWMRDTTLAVKSAAMAAGTFLVTPYAYIYDAVVLTVGAAFLLKDCLDRGFKEFDKAFLCLSYLLPGLFLSGFAHSAIAPASALLVLFLALRRAAPCTIRYGLASHRPAQA